MSGVSPSLYWASAIAIDGVIGSTFGAIVSFTLALFTNCADAQITPDNTLPSNSNVQLEGSTFNITGGTQAGSNLFHSFQKFSVPINGTAFFNNAADIQNIISRVTGGSVSNIDGIIRANGTANLFLINPNGIIFGPNASLDIRGAFLASTASSLKFADSTQFSATAPQTTPLLTISVPIGLQFGANPKGIQLNGASLLDNQVGSTRMLIGGDVVLNNSGIRARGGRVELGGLAEAGTVNLAINNNDVILNFPPKTARSDVSLSDGSVVNVSGVGGGSIVINANNLKMSEGSALWAGIMSGLGSVDSKAGNIDINATGAIDLTNGSYIQNLMFSRAVGNGGDINIYAESVSATDGSNVIASTFGKGDAGNVTINARDRISFDGEELVDSQSPFSGVYSQVGANAVGNGGNINVTARSLSLTNGAQLFASTYGQGRAGNVTINAADLVYFDGVGMGPKLSFPSSGAYSTVAKTGQGKAGNINIMTGSLIVRNGALVTASTDGFGDAGNVTINASDKISFDGVGINKTSSGAYSNVTNNGIGKGGSVNVTTGLLSVNNGARLEVSTFGQGNAGQIFINARDIVLDGVGGNESSTPSSVVTIVGKTGEGKGGEIDITTGSLTVTNGAELLALTEGQGDAGSVKIKAQNAVSLNGVAASLGFSSGLFSGNEKTAIGYGGEIRVTTPVLRISNGAVLSARTFNTFRGGDILVDVNNLEISGGGEILTTTFSGGQAGNITVNAPSDVTISGSDPNFSARFLQFNQPLVDPASAVSGIFANTNPNSTGQGGDIKMTIGQLTVRDEAKITASSQGTGNAGDMNITARSLKLDNGSITTSSSSGSGGNINKLQVQDFLLLRNKSFISTSAGTDLSGGGNGGNITINSPFIIAIPKEDSDLLANAFQGKGGNIQITTSGIFGIQFRSENTRFSDITASSKFGVNGTVQINNPDVDPSRGLVPLSIEVVDVTGLIDQNLCAATSNSNFTIIGKGGLPPSPNSALNSNAVWEDWRFTTVPTRASGMGYGALERLAQKANYVNSRANEIIEAQGLAVNAKGEVVLTAAPTVTPYGSWNLPSGCHPLRK
ncbi:hypothetical protein NUACC26_095170 [Scytonema sp. NUACC26]